jgi:transposase
MCLYVREITNAEGQRLQKVIRHDTNRIKVRRAQVVLASAQGARVAAIARRFYYSEAQVRTIIRDFNAHGLEALAPRYRGGRPPKFTADQRSLVVETALCPPDLLGRPFTRWSLDRLRQYLLDQGVVESISLEWLRQILHGSKVRLQRTKTWKECNDPELASKRN